MSEDDSEFARYPASYLEDNQIKFLGGVSGLDRLKLERLITEFIDTLC